MPAERADDLVAHLNEKLSAGKALGRDGTVADVANAAVFFASDLSAYISCNVLAVDGGLSSYTLSTSDADITAAANAFIEQ